MSLVNKDKCLFVVLEKRLHSPALLWLGAVLVHWCIRAFVHQKTKSQHKSHPHVEVQKVRTTLPTIHLQKYTVSNEKTGGRLGIDKAEICPNIWMHKNKCMKGLCNVILTQKNDLPGGNQRFFQVFLTNWPACHGNTSTAGVDNKRNKQEVTKFLQETCVFSLKRTLKVYDIKEHKTTTEIIQSSYL